MNVFMMRACSCVTLLIIAIVCVSGVRSSAQEASAASPTVKILSPVADTYVSGPTRLLAYVYPPSAADTVTFFADGRQACQVATPPFECIWDAGSNVTARQFRVVVRLGTGGRVVRTVRTKGLDFVEKVDVDAVQVTVTVMDDDSNFVPELPRSAFRIFEDDKLQSISAFTSENIPTEMIVAIDISGSMTIAMTKLKESVKRFLAAIPESDEVTLLGFNDTLFALTRRAMNVEERARAVDRLAPWGATALYDVIVQGVDMLGRRTGRKALVVFTDGEDQGSHVTLDEVERRLQASDVTLYMIGQGRGVQQEYLQQVMTRLSVPTGGRMFSTDNIDSLQGAFEVLLDELSNQYLLGYQPMDRTRDDQWREIRVEVEGHRNVRARQGYRAAPDR
jgi:VWFA-related protein